MARVFGKMSYCPEDIGFIMNGIAGKYGEPLTIFNHKLVKNILLAAYRTPSTAKELAIELGVALPYMEDELEKLVSETLLRKNCKKYETNIVIVSAKAQEDIYLNLKEITSALTNAVIELLEYDMACKEKNGSQWNEGYQSYEDAKWTLLMQTVDKVKEGILNEYKKTIVNLPVVKLGKFGHTIRPNRR